MPDSTNSTSVERGDFAFCEECLAYGSDRVILRICLSCGHVGCAEGSPGDHAAEHYAETDHPVAATVGSASASRWCYPDERPL
jgi:monovalent cation/hydrogen antiporter